MGGPESPVTPLPTPQSLPLQVALLRAVVGGLILAASAFLTSYSMSNQLKASGLAAASAFVAYLIIRGGAEGWIDTNAARNTTG